MATDESVRVPVTGERLDTLYGSARRRAGTPSSYQWQRRQLLKSRPAATSSSLSDTQYLVLRQTLLSKQYGPPPPSTSYEKRSRTGSTVSSSHSLVRHQQQPHQRSKSVSSQGGSGPRGGPGAWDRARMASYTSESSLPPDGGATAALYSASGDGKIVYQHHKQAVSIVRFANTSTLRFACGCADGTASICLVKDGSEPDAPCILTGHMQAVTDLQWSANDAYLITTSLDSTIRLWSTDVGSPIRTMKDFAPVLCCCFNSENNNLFVVGNKNGDVKTYNLSTGKIVDNNAVINVRFAVTSVVFDPLGRLLFAGTENGEVHVFSFSAGHGSFTKVYRTSVSNNGPHAILSLALAPAFAKETYQPCLLVSAKDNTVKLLGVGSFLRKRSTLASSNSSPSRLAAAVANPLSQLQHKITLESQFVIKSNVQAVLCPLMSMQKGPCFVTGGEGNSVQVYQCVPGKLLQTLKAHSAPVLSVCWNRDESFLVSSDRLGAVVLWKRALFVH